MSTILKALRRLEEDRPPSDRSVSAPSAAGGEPDALGRRSNSSGATSDSLGDPLRERILAEEAAAWVNDANDASRSRLQSALDFIADHKDSLATVTVLLIAVGLITFSLSGEAPNNIPNPRPAADASGPTAGANPGFIQVAEPDSRAVAGASPSGVREVRRARPNSPRRAPLPVAAADQAAASAPPTTPTTAGAADAETAREGGNAAPVLAAGAAVTAATAVALAADSGSNGGSAAAAPLAASSAASPPRPPAASPPRPPAASASRPQSRTPARTVAAQSAPAEVPAAAVTPTRSAAATQGPARTASPPSSAPSGQVALHTRADADSRPRPSAREIAPTAVSARANATPGERRPSERASAATPKAATSDRPAAARTQPRKEKQVERIDRRGLPDIRVLRTSWHPRPDNRSARIRLEDSKKVLNLQEGDAVGALVVKEISPSSVLFAAGEIEIRRRVGQSGGG